MKKFTFTQQLDSMDCGPACLKMIAEWHGASYTLDELRALSYIGTEGVSLLSQRQWQDNSFKTVAWIFSPTEGEIEIGGENLQKFNLEWWRMQCGAVMQDGFIFSDSIARNIATSGDEINERQLFHAVSITNLEEFVDDLPLKFNTVIGQEGQGLSQGQKQRILIARAVYKNPDFIFLDEATNSLDASNEKTIIENLKSFYEGKTVVVVAHRLSTVKDADQIIVLDKGEIVEFGNHFSLTSQKGRYFELVKNQLELGV